MEQSAHRRNDEREESHAKARQDKPASSKASKGFTDEERAALKERAEEAKIGALVEQAVS